MQKLILGTVQLGTNYGINNSTGKPSTSEAFNILQLAWEYGLRTLDTAEVYGDAQATIGKYQEESGNHFTINSKFKGNSPIAEQLNKTLEELKTDKLNYYFYHNFSDIKDLSLLNQLVGLKRSGKVRAIGASIYDNSELEQAINTDDIDVIQLPFNLFDNMNERGSLITEAKEKNKIMQVRSVYLQGLFFKRPESLPEKLTPLKRYLETINQIAKDRLLTIEELCVAYVTQQPQIDEIVIGVESIKQLEHNFELFSRTYPANIVDEVNKIKISEKELLYPKNWN